MLKDKSKGESEAWELLQETRRSCKNTYPAVGEVNLMLHFVSSYFAKKYGASLPTSRRSMSHSSAKG